LSDFLEQLQREKGGDLSKFKNDELKDVLRKVGQRTTGKKADLVASLEAYLEEHDLLGKKKKKRVKKEEDEMEIDGEDEELVAKPAKRRKKSASADDSE
jgi:thermostable 8-oxoguanine DNA glycosylase